MAEEDKENRTEEPSAKRLSKAIEEGRVARSPDLVFAALILCAAMFLGSFGERMSRAFHGVFVGALDDIASGGPDPAFDLGLASLTECLLAAAPLLAAIFAISLVLAFSQAGLNFVPQKLDFKPEKLMPRLALSTFVNPRSLIETVTSLLKLGALGFAAWSALASPVKDLLSTYDTRMAAKSGIALLVRLLQYVGGALLALGVLDWFWKRRQHFKDLRMTKEEVKQETKDALGDPEAKARIRGKQRQFAMQRMMEQVPKASAVVVNPTHFAVAIKYEKDMAAPLVLAKGRDHVALRIKSIARQAGVPIVENPPLARALHDSTRVGDEIPPTLYQAVAEVLAAIFRTDRRQARRVDRRPA